jgi:hypothetical protein
LSDLTDFAIGIVLLASAAGGALVVLESRRWMLLGLLGVYGSAMALMSASLPYRIAGVQLLSGALVGMILLLSQVRSHWAPRFSGQYSVPSGWVFRLSGTMLVVISMWGLWRSGLEIFPGVKPAAELGGLILMGLGLLNAGISDDAYRVGVGLLTMTTGFEVGFTTIEPSLALVALLAAVDVGIALLVGYLMVAVAPSTPESEKGA